MCHFCYTLLSAFVCLCVLECCHAVFPSHAAAARARVIYSNTHTHTHTHKYTRRDVVTVTVVVGVGRNKILLM